jgi:hypothetical protein
MKNHTQEIYIDHNIPLEQQLSSLRQSSIDFQFNAFEVLKEKLGNEGIEIFKAILRRGFRKAIDKYRDKSFEDIKKVAGIPERVLGFQTELDYVKDDEVQYFITFCPFLEESKHRGMDMNFCNIFEKVETEEVSQYLGEISEPSRMCFGDSKCTIRIRNTLGR